MKLFITWLIVLNIPVCAQTRISGFINDERGEGIPGANVSLKGTYDGSSTDINGSFAFTTSEKGSQMVIVTFVGYKTAELPVEVNGRDIEVKISLRDEINELDAVTITAGSFTAGEEKRRTVLKAVDIATTAGATADIAGALNTLPGTQKVGETGRLFVRGGDDTETRTFIDGVLVLDPYGPSAPNTPSRGRFLPFMFKGTSFSTGGYSAEYGQALSSALVLNSKDRAESSQTDIGLLSVGADVAHTQSWERSSLAGKVQYTNIRPYFGLINQRVDWILPPASLQVSTAYRVMTGKDGMLKFFGNYNATDFSLYEHSVGQPEVRFRQDLNNRFGYGNMAYRQSLSANWSIRGGASFNYNENSLSVNGIPANEKESGIHAKVALEHSPSDRVDIRVGSEVIARDYSAWMQDEETFEVRGQSFREIISAAFAEVEAYSSKHFVVKAGGRLEHNSLNGLTSVDPRASVAYRPGDKGQFSFAYGTFRQSAANKYLRGTPSLLPGRAEHFILNYQIISNDRTLRVEAYHKKYNDLVKFEKSNPFAPGNNGSGYARGFDFFWRDNKSLRNVDYWVSYSYLDTERDYLNFPSAAVPEFASKHNLSIVYKHFVTKLKSQIGLTWSYSSGRPYNNPNHSKFNAEMTPAYQDLSANIAYLPKPWLIIYTSCTNLLGRDNIFGYRYAAVPAENGVYASEAIRQPALRFVFLGVFITLSKNKTVNQLPNL